MTGTCSTQDFESLTDKLQTALDRPAPAGMIGWTPTAPAGWSVVNAPDMPQAPGHAGLDVHDEAHVQHRGTGPAELRPGPGHPGRRRPDDWDDTGSPSTAGRSTRRWSRRGSDPGRHVDLYLVFDSHYLQYAVQTATVTATFDVGDPVPVLLYSADATGNDNAGGDAQNTEVSKQIAVRRSQRVTLRFRMFNAGNDWYWRSTTSGSTASPLFECTSPATRPYRVR